MIAPDATGCNVGQVARNTLPTTDATTYRTTRSMCIEAASPWTLTFRSSLGIARPGSGPHVALVKEQARVLPSVYPLQLVLALVPLDSVPEPADPRRADRGVDEIDRRRVVRRALRTLPAKCRDALVLFYFHDLDVASTARSLGLPAGTRALPGLVGALVLLVAVVRGFRGAATVAPLGPAWSPILAALTPADSLEAAGLALALLLTLFLALMTLRLVRT